MGCAPSSVPVGTRGTTQGLRPRHVPGRRFATSAECQRHEERLDSSGPEVDETRERPGHEAPTLNSNLQVSKGSSTEGPSTVDREEAHFTGLCSLPIDGPANLTSQGFSSVFDDEEGERDDPAVKDPTLGASNQITHEGRLRSLTAIQKVSSLQSSCYSTWSSGDAMPCINATTAEASSTVGPRDCNQSNSFDQKMAARLSKSDVSLSVVKTEGASASTSLPVFQPPSMPLPPLSPQVGLPSGLHHSRSRSEGSVWDLGIQPNVEMNQDEPLVFALEIQPQHVPFVKMSPTISNRSRRSLEPFPTHADAVALLQSRTSNKLAAQDSQDRESGGDWEEDSIRRRSSGFSVTEPLDPQWWLHYIRQRSA
jgi:hypothetical protein